MAMSVAVKLLLSTATSKKGMNGILFVILGGFMVLTMLFGVILPPVNDEAKLYEAALFKLATEEMIEGEINAGVIRTVYSLLHNKFPTTEKQIIKFISSNFILEYEDAESVTHKRFFTQTELLDRILNPPFSFDDAQYSMVYFAFQAPPLNGQPPSEGITPPDVTPPDGNTGTVTPPPIGKTLQMPCTGRISSAWGYRDDPITPGELELHTGMDIAGTWHQPIYAAESGIVVSTNTKKSGYGNYIQIKHSSNGITYYSFYAHMSKLMVSVDTQVSKGQQIGLEGGDPQSDTNPGDSTGHHLHFELRLQQSRDTTFDPYPYFE